MRIADNNSLGNLNRHVCGCVPEATQEKKVMAKFVTGCPYMQEHFQFQLALWVTCKCPPYAIVGDEELVTAFCMLYGKVEVPSHFSVIWDIKMMY